jgi:hypothetical protein
VAKAEELLRRASTSGAASAKVRQNLALVLGLQGKYEEATQVGSAVLPHANAQANAELLRKIVKLEPKPLESRPDPAELPQAAVQLAAWDTDVSEPPPRRPALKSTMSGKEPRREAPEATAMAETPPAPALKPSAQ